jgi:uncharacterized protein (TIGR00297 family)
MSLIVLAAIGLALNGAAALLALWRRSVDAGGAAAGVVVGTAIFAAGGPLFWLILAAFFLSSTALGRIGRKDKQWLDAIHQKGDRRDLVQVLANGGIGMAAAVFFRITGNPGWALGFAVSFASSNADTWSSEIGVLSRSAPVSLVGFRSVPRGVSGGVSLLGTLTALAGAAFIAVIFAAENLSLHAITGGFPVVFLFVTAGGFTGSIVDSLLGATVQAQYAHGLRAQRVLPHERFPWRSGSGDIVTERSHGEDGRPHRLVRGLPFVTNDVVNLASCALVTAAAVLLAPILS